jgi:hypothetical protein
MEEEWAEKRDPRTLLKQIKRHLPAAGLTPAFNNHPLHGTIQPMTTLIIHPDIVVQKNTAFGMVNRYFLHPPDDLPEAQAPSLDMPEMEIPKLLIHPDLHLIDGTVASSIGIDEVRSLIKKLQFHPYEAPVQIGMIIMANMLTEEAQNSLLKTLEEPTEETRFILTTPHEKFLLPTIRSRAQKQFIKEKITAVIPKAAPAIREGETEEDREGEIRDSDIPIEDFVRKDLVDKLLYLEVLVTDDKEYPGAIIRFLAELTQLYREKLIDAARSNDTENASRHSAELKRISRAMHYINRNANKRLTLENLILHLEQSIMLRRPSDGNM